MPNERGQFVKGEHWREPRPHWQRQWLVDAYVIASKSTGDIAAECGCTAGAIVYWLQKHGIARRSMSEARARKKWGVRGAANPMHGKTGPANPRYGDGSSPERQRLYAQGAGREFIRNVLARDGYRCLRCCTPKSGSRSLHVHHLKPWAGNEALRFDPMNAATLCRPCHHFVHSKENTAREFLA